MPTVQHDILNDLCYRIFAATGIPEADARTVADHVVESHLNGHDSHGTWLVPNYARSMQKNYVPWENAEIERDTPALRIVNGKGANGIVACNRAIDIAVEKAKKSTFGFVGLNSVSHICRLGDYPPRIAEQGMIGMVWLNGGGLFLSPFGSADRRLRPEPIAFSAPRQSGPPFMLDMTMTVVAGGKIVQKNIRDEPLPEGWVIDQEGKAVADAGRYMNDPEGTGVLPLGGMQFRTISTRHQTAKPQFPRRQHFRQSTDGRSTRPVQHGQHGALGGNTGHGLGVIDGAQPTKGTLIIGTAGQSDGALAASRQKLVGRKDCCGFICHA